MQKKTVTVFVKHIVRLYEQGADINRIEQYVLKWLQWTRAGIHELLKNQPLMSQEIFKLDII